MLTIESSGALQSFQHLGTRLTLAAVCWVCYKEAFSRWILPIYTSRQGVLWFWSIWVLLCKSFYSFQKQNPDSASKLSCFTFVWFFRIFSLQNSPKDILLSRLNCIWLSTGEILREKHQLKRNLGKHCDGSILYFVLILPTISQMTSFIVVSSKFFM